MSWNLGPHQNLHMNVYMNASFIIAQTWKQPRCPSVHQGISKLLHLENGLYFSTKNKQKIIKSWKDGGNLNVYYRVKEANVKSLHP